MQVRPRPFLKYVGGKTKLLPELLKRVPEKYGTYREPFVGGGALFFALAPKRAVLSDANERLIRTYRAVRDDVDAVIKGLYRAEAQHSKSFFEFTRAMDIDRRNDVQVAIWMIYLNKTCFNGLYRVNKKGKFNVPFGKHANPTICDEENLRVCSRALQGVQLLPGDFRAVSKPAPGDFVYCDPPYVPLSATSSFTAYSADGFGMDDQRELRSWADFQRGRGVHVLLSNSSAPAVYDLYAEFAIEEVMAPRAINSKGDRRGKIAEVIIR